MKINLKLFILKKKKTARKTTINRQHVNLNTYSYQHNNDIVLIHTMKVDKAIYTKWNFYDNIN
jgi:hypothetical protein